MTPCCDTFIILNPIWQKRWKIQKYDLKKATSVLTMAANDLFTFFAESKKRRKKVEKKILTINNFSVPFQWKVFTVRIFSSSSTFDNRSEDFVIPYSWSRGARKFRGKLSLTFFPVNFSFYDILQCKFGFWFFSVLFIYLLLLLNKLEHIYFSAKIFFLNQVRELGTYILHIFQV